MPLPSQISPHVPLACSMYSEPFFASAPIELPLRDRLVQVVASPQLPVTPGCAGGIPVETAAPARTFHCHYLKCQLGQAARGLLRRIDARIHAPHPASGYQKLHTDSDDDVIVVDDQESGPHRTGEAVWDRDEVNSETPHHHGTTKTTGTMPASVRESFLWQHIRSLEQENDDLQAQLDNWQRKLSVRQDGLPPA